MAKTNSNVETTEYGYGEVYDVLIDSKNLWRRANKRISGRQNTKSIK